MKPSEYAKATTSAVLAGLGSLGTALADGTITGQEWVAVALAVVATFGTVFGVRNKRPPKRQRVRRDTARADLLYVLWCVVLALAAIALLVWLA